MSVEKITARILQEANAEAESVKNKAKADVDALLTQARQDAEASAKAVAAKAEEDAKILLERRASVAELEARKLHLAAKQEMVDAAFAQALEELSIMESGKYLEFMLQLLAPYKNQSGEIVLNEKDQANLKAALEKELAETGLTVAADTAAIKGGFILRQGSVSLNASLEKLLENERKQITAQIAQTLFS